MVGTTLSPLLGLKAWPFTRRETRQVKSHHLGPHFRSAPARQRKVANATACEWATITTSRDRSRVSNSPRSDALFLIAEARIESSTNLLPRKHIVAGAGGEQTHGLNGETPLAALPLREGRASRPGEARAQSRAPHVPARGSCSPEAPLMESTDVGKGPSRIFRNGIFLNPLSS